MGHVWAYVDSNWRSTVETRSPLHPYPPPRSLFYTEGRLKSLESTKTSGAWQALRFNNKNSDNNKYISKALNPSVSNLHEAQSAVNVQLKLSKLYIQVKTSKQRNQRRQKLKKPGRGGWRGKVQMLSKQLIYVT